MRNSRQPSGNPFLAALATAALLAMTATAAPAALPTTQPAKHWATTRPADAGLDATSLDRFRDAIGGRGCIVRHGYMVCTWGDASKAGDVASAAKPVYSHLLLRAVVDGRIPSLDEAVVRHEPRLGELNADLGFKDRRITWRHLANQTSCYGVSENPGEAYDYSDPQMALFWDLLFTKVYDGTWDTVDEKVLRPMLADAIGCEDRPTFMAFGTKNRPGRLAISPRDFCRFGLLQLQRGRWGDRQLLDEKLAVMAVTSPLSNDIRRTADKKAAMLPGQRSIGGGNNMTDHFGSYSFLWWTNGIDREGKRHWPDLPTDAYAALGHGGKRGLLVVPSLHLVASWNDSKIDGRDSENRVLGQLVGSVMREP